MTATIKLGQLAEVLGATLRGSAEKEITGLATLQEAGPAQLSFLANPQYRKFLVDSQAGAVLLKAADAEGYAGDALVVPDPYLAYARISHLFDPKPKAAAGIHPSAVVAADASVDPTASIGPFVVIESGARIGAGVTLGAHCFIGARCEIGEGGCCTTMFVSASGWSSSRAPCSGVRASVSPTKKVSGTRSPRSEERGGVLVGDDVEIGVNTAIDRGALADTILGNGVKLDNQIQIAHNVQVGDHTAMAACCGISGSTKIGKHCMLAGGVGLVGHIEICDNVFLTGMTMVTHSITEPGAYSSGTAMQPAAEWRKSAARIRQLDDMARRLRQLEKRVGDVTPDAHASSEG